MGSSSATSARHALWLLLTLLLASCGHRASADLELRSVLEGYRHFAETRYRQSVDGIVALQASLQGLEASPGPEALEAAREAWRRARIPYAQSEVLRFGNWFVDEADARINAWPVDEGVLDYVGGTYQASVSNPLARFNLIANQQLLVGGRALSLELIQRRKLLALQELSDVEANVTTGYHALEFWLWGQDLNGHGPGAGQRPWTDFSQDENLCTDGATPAPLIHCLRRHQALAAAAESLRLELLALTAMWGEQSGSYGDRLVRGDARDGLRRMLFGMVAMASEEMAAERIQVALWSHAPEEEQDCFSDQTHESLFQNGVGVAAVYQGESAQMSLQRLAQRDYPQQASALQLTFAAAGSQLQQLRERGESGQRFDQLIAPDNAEGHELLQATASSLMDLAEALEKLADAMGLGPLNPQAAN